MPRGNYQSKFRLRFRAAPQKKNRRDAEDAEKKDPEMLAPADGRRADARPGPFAFAQDRLAGAPVPTRTKTWARPQTSIPADGTSSCAANHAPLFAASQSTPPRSTRQSPLA